VAQGSILTISPVEKSKFTIYSLDGKVINKEQSVPNNGKCKLTIAKEIYVLKVIFGNNNVFEKIEIR
jgi:hypothetical protein